jgi:hypothetical protein
MYPVRFGRAATWRLASVHGSACTPFCPVRLRLRLHHLPCGMSLLTPGAVSGVEAAFLPSFQSQDPVYIPLPRKGARRAPPCPFCGPARSHCSQHRTIAAFKQRTLGFHSPNHLCADSWSLGLISGRFVRWEPHGSSGKPMGFQPQMDQFGAIAAIVRGCQTSSLLGGLGRA